MKNIIASRNISCSDGRVIAVNIFEPLEISENESVCSYEIIGLDRNISHSARGEDRVQAVMLALQTIGSELEI